MATADNRIATDSLQPEELYEILTAPPRPLMEALDQVVNLGPENVKRKTLERRMAVARMRLLGMRNQTHIADTLGVNKGTVCRDFQALDRLWREEATESIQAEKAIDLARIEVGVMAVMPGVERGEPRAIDALVTLLTRKAKMLGHDEARHLEVDWRSELGKAGIEDTDTLYQEVVLLVSGRFRISRDAAARSGAHREDTAGSFSVTSSCT